MPVGGAEALGSGSPVIGSGARLTAGVSPRRRAGMGQLGVGSRIRSVWHAEKVGCGAAI